MHRNLHKNKYNRGVTLIELLVVIAIFMMISSITIFSYGKFNSSLSIQNLADDIALSVRRAQGYAIGVRGFTGSFGDGYGVHFTYNPITSDLYAGSSKSFILFADLASFNNQYDYDASKECGLDSINNNNECLELLSIISADNISGIYLNDDSDSISAQSTLDIIFKRPNPEPYFCYRLGGIGSCSSFTISSIKIKISTDADPAIYKIIRISNNGQINVSN